MIPWLELFAFVLFLLGMAFLIQGPPYVPSSDASVEQMLEEIKHIKPKRVLDMGSGKGKLVITLAKQGYQVDGVELNPWLVWQSKRAIKRAGLQDKAKVKWGNFWKYDVSDYDLVAIYVIKHIMPRLEEKLTAELKSGSHIVSNYFVFPNLKPIKQTERARVYKV